MNLLKKVLCTFALLFPPAFSVFATHVAESFEPTEELDTFEKISLKRSDAEKSYYALFKLYGNDPKMSETILDFLNLSNEQMEYFNRRSE